MAYYLISGENNYERIVHNYLQGFNQALKCAKAKNSNVRVLFNIISNANDMYLGEALGQDSAHKLCGSSSKKLTIGNVDFHASSIGSLKSKSTFKEKVFLVFNPQLRDIEAKTKILDKSVDIIVIEYHAEPGDIKRWELDSKAKKI